MTNLPDAISRYFDNYKDFLIKFPPDGQKQASRYYDVDCRHTQVLNKLRCNKNYNRFTTRDEKHLKKMLLTSLNLADKKVEISKRLMDMVNKNFLNLQMSIKNIEMAQIVDTTPSKKSKRVLKRTPNYKEIDSDSTNNVLNVANSNRRRSNKNETKLNKNFHIISKLNKDGQTSETIFADIIQNAKKTNMDDGPRKKRSKSDNQRLLESPNSDDTKKEVYIEPAYCICEEISYGNMVCCDNDLCPIEWFHFGCVSISRKPKGKWYCPRCRGNNSKTMKPREIFFKELEEYNKRKEEGC